MVASKFRSVTGLGLRGARLGVAGLALLACGPQGPTAIDLSKLNFDTEIDGGGVDYKNFDENWKPDKFDSFEPQICVGKDQTVYVVWYEKKYLLDEAGELVLVRDEPQPDGFVDVWFNKSLDGGLTWGNPVQVKQGPGDASGVTMACAGDRVFVAWEDTRDGETNYQNIYLNYSTDAGETWQGEDTAIDADPEGYAISLGPKLALFEGRVHVVWYDQVNGAPDIYMSTSINGGRKFQPPVLIGAGNADGEGDDVAGSSWNGNPQVQVDPTGRIWVVWESTRNGKQDIFAAISNSGGEAFDPKKRVDTGDERGSHYSFSPRLGVSDTAAYVVWHDDRGGEKRDVYMNYSGDGGTTWLDAAERVDSGDTPGFSESLNPELVVLGDQAHIVWQDNREFAYDVYYRIATAGAFPDGSEEVRIDRDQIGTANSTFPRLAYTDGKFAAVWSDYRNADVTYNDLFYNNTPGAEGDVEDDGWTEDDMLVTSALEGQSFTVDHRPVILGDRLLTTWVDGRNGSLDVFFSGIVLGDGVDNLEKLAQAAGVSTTAP
jgi:hypothetical protein